jgi:glycosidase
MLKAKDGSGNPIPPNNWLDIFTGETAWEWEPARQQFYLHSFDVHQPDLNWANPEVREAIKSAMRFWLDRGVDGFRVDAVRFMGKDPLFKNNPPNPDYKPGEWSNYGSIKHIYSQGTTATLCLLSRDGRCLKEKNTKNHRVLWLLNLIRKHEKSCSRIPGFLRGNGP